MSKQAAKHQPLNEALTASKKFRFLGLTKDDYIKYFFAGNAWVALFILLLITTFLFKEGFAFFGGNRDSLELYRRAGLEYVDIMYNQRERYAELQKKFDAIRTLEITRINEEARERLKNELSEMRRLKGEDLEAFYNAMVVFADNGEVPESKQAILDQFPPRYVKGLADDPLVDLPHPGGLEGFQSDFLEFLARQRKNLPNEIENFQRTGELLASEFAFSKSLNDLGRPLSQFTLDVREQAAAVKEAYLVNQNEKIRIGNLIKAGKPGLASQIEVIDYTDEVFREKVEPIIERTPEFLEISATLKSELSELVANPPELAYDRFAGRLDSWFKEAETFLADMDKYPERLDAWEQFAPVTYWTSIYSFLTGKQWLTGSQWQDFYGILPLFAGSFMIATVAIMVSVPFSVGAAIYVNQIAGKREQNFIKPYIEFIEALPSVVLGFFGIVVLGDFLQMALGLETRLNAFNASLLLALMAVPTIFSLTEDAINNVPRAYKEASLAMGATQFQTTIRIVLPTALSGIISAILLGFGRVIGETMVVLLVAGNRIAIPDFTEGLGVFFQPVHTMTGIVAQELGEVEQGSIHWQALFVVGVCLFFLALLINFIAQRVVKRFQLSAG